MSRLQGFALDFALRVLSRFFRVAVVTVVGRNGANGFSEAMAYSKGATFRECLIASDAMLEGAKELSASVQRELDVCAVEHGLDITGGA